MNDLNWKRFVKAINQYGANIDEDIFTYSNEVEALGNIILLKDYIDKFLAVILSGKGAKS